MSITKVVKKKKTVVSAVQFNNFASVDDIIELIGTDNIQVSNDLIVLPDFIDGDLLKGDWLLEEDNQFKVISNEQFNELYEPFKPTRKRVKTTESE